MLEGVASELSHPHLMTFRVEMALETVFIFALLPAKFAKELQSVGAHQIL
jgi:hypothetical protein